MLNGMEIAATDSTLAKLQNLESFAQKKRSEWTSPECSFGDLSADWFQEKIASGIVRMQTHDSNTARWDSKLEVKSTCSFPPRALESPQLWKQASINVKRRASLKCKDPDGIEDILTSKTFLEIILFPTSNSNAQGNKSELAQDTSQKNLPSDVPKNEFLITSSLSQVRERSNIRSNLFSFLQSAKWMQTSSKCNIRLSHMAVGALLVDSTFQPSKLLSRSRSMSFALQNLASPVKLKHPSALVDLKTALNGMQVQDSRKDSQADERKLEQQKEQKRLNVHEVSSSKRLTHKGNVFRQLLCGGFAGVVSRTAVAPLDLVKTHLIIGHGSYGQHISAIAVFLKIIKEDGWKGLFRGNGVNCIRVAPCKAIELCVFEIVKKLLSKDGNPLQHVAAPIAGGAAGMAGTLATYPFEVLRTRISIQPEHYNNMISAVTKMLREEGFGAFYAGLAPSLVGVFPYSATNYFVYDGLRSTYRRATGNHSVPTILTLLFGAIAAAASSTVTFPTEVARKQLQLGSKGLIMHRSAMSVIREIYFKEGFWALYRGLGTTWLKLVPAAGISFVCYEAARIALEVDDACLIKSKSTSRLMENKQ